jgi:carboxymethylenebutenolidase
MIEKEVEIRMPDGTADGVLFQPEGNKKLPGVMHLPDIGGVRPAHREMAKRLAGEGYVVLLPNVFYRAGKSPVWEFPFKMGEERTMKRLGELAGTLPPANMVKDISAYIEFLEKQDSVSPASMGAVGYCFTGAMALRAAAARPDKIGGAASFHGGALYTDKPDSPHTVLPEVKARLYFGHADGDPYMPQEAIAKLDAALAAWSTATGGKYESETYAGAHHGWTVPDSPVYNKEQAERAYGKLRELFKAALR